MNSYKSGHKLKDAFNKLDLDRDGYIALSELRRSLVLADIHDELTTKQQRRLCKTYKKLDDNHDGRLDYNEFVRAITKPDYGSSLWQKFVYSIIGVVLPEQECENVYEKLNEKICLPPPIFFISLSFVQILAYVILVVRNYEFNLWEGCPGCYNETVKDKIVHKLVFLSYRRTDFWRYISYILIHSGFLHVAGNVFVQISVGLPYEIVHNFWRVVLLYITGVLGAALLLPICDPKAALVGASGGCYALLIVHVVNFVKNWCDMKRRWSHSVLLILFLGADLSMAAYRRLTFCDQISFCGHLGGLLAAGTIGLALFLQKISFCADYRSFKIYKVVCRSLTFVIFVVLFSALVCLNVILPVQDDGDYISLQYRCNYTLK